MARRVNAHADGAAAMALHPLDRDVEAMLRKSQPGYFSGEGDDVGKQLEEWLEKMEDYFDLAHSSEENKAMMGRFKLEKSAKLWWQDHCREHALQPANTTWDYISTQLSKNYQSRTYRIERLNEFLDCSQGKDTLDVFYQRFLKLLKYAPAGMNQDAKVARFVSKLNPPMDTRLQSLRLTTFADVLDAGRPVETELNRGSAKDSKAHTPKENFTRDSNNRKRESDNPSHRPTEARQRLPPHLLEKARQENLCLGCLDPTHQIRHCPYVGAGNTPAPKAPTGNAQNLPRGNGGNNGRNNYNNQNPNLIPVANNCNFNNNPNGNGGINQNPNRQNPPRPAPPQANQRSNTNLNPRNQPQRAQVHQMQTVEETEDEVAHLNAAIEHQGPNRQYAVLQTPAEYEGNTFHLLIDSGATHSFISPASVRKLNLQTQKDTKLKVELATGKQTQSSTSVKNLNFTLGGTPTTASF